MSKQNQSVSNQPHHYSLLHEKFRFQRLRDLLPLKLALKKSLLFRWRIEIPPGIRTMDPILDVSVASSFGSPIMFNPKRGIEASAGVFKDILLGNDPCDPNNESFNSNADFEDLDQMVSYPRPSLQLLQKVYSQPLHYQHHSVRHRSSRSAHPGTGGSNLDLRRVGSQMTRPHSHSPARMPTARRYSPPQGSTGSGGTKSPIEVSPKTSWDHGSSGGAPLSTSSPMTSRRLHNLRGAPYYVADTVRGHPDHSLDMYVDHNSSGGSTGSASGGFIPGGGGSGPHFVSGRHPRPGGGSKHHLDLSMVSKKKQLGIFFMGFGYGEKDECYKNRTALRKQY